MRIGFDGKRIFHNFRGLGNYSRTLVDGILKYFPEQEIFLFTPPFKDEKSRNWANNHSKAKIISPNSLMFEKIPSIWRSFYLHKELTNHEMEIYHGLSHEIPFFSDEIKCKKVVTIHDLIFKRFPNFFSPIDRLIYGKKYAHSCKKADLIIAICEQTKKDLIEIMGVPAKKIEVVYQSCNPIFTKDLTDIEKKAVRKKYNLPEKFLLFVGALEENKNAFNLVRAFGSLKLKDYNLVIIGRGESYKAKLLKEVEELNIKETVIFYDFIPTEDLPGFYQMSSLFVFPSFFEGFGIPIIEALFSKTPVITTKGHCFPEAGGPLTIYVDTSDPREIAKAIEKVLGSKSLPDEMIGAGLNYVQRFNLKISTEKLISHYISLNPQ
jgi:glycosyltransferase involved in cell wall biosynthesis